MASNASLVSKEERERRHLELIQSLINRPVEYLDPSLTDPRHRSIRDVPQPSTDARLLNTDWCSCGNCVQLPTVEENKCCREILKMKEMVTEGSRCVCENLYVKERLGRRELMIELFRYGLSFQRKRFRSAAQMNESDYRKTAYRAFTMWVYGYLGPSRRRPIPACVVQQIRQHFPNPENHFRGRYDPTDDCNAADFLEVVF